MTYSKTLKENAAQAARILGCPEDKIKNLEDELSSFSFPLSKKSLVYQVSNAMTTLGIKVDTSKHGEAINKVW
mgnify:CR=1 FL=1